MLFCSGGFPQEKYETKSDWESPFAQQSGAACETMREKNIQSVFSTSVYTKFNGEERIIPSCGMFFPKGSQKRGENPAVKPLLRELRQERRNARFPYI